MSTEYLYVVVTVDADGKHRVEAFGDFERAQECYETARDEFGFNASLHSVEPDGWNLTPWQEERS